MFTTRLGFVSTALLIAADCGSTAAPDGTGVFQGESEAKRRPTSMALPPPAEPDPPLRVDPFAGFDAEGPGVFVGFGLDVAGVGVGTGIGTTVRVARALATSDGAAL